VLTRRAAHGRRNTLMINELGVFMVNKAKAKGTSGENGIVQALNEAGWIHAERRTQGGTQDRGDINIGGFPVMIESKNCKTITIPAWLREVEVEKANANAEVGVAWFKIRGKGHAKDWAVVMTGQEFMDLLRRAGYHPEAGR
jgi:hypothetical protein